MKDWDKLDIDSQNVERYFDKPKLNVGVLLGAPSDDLVCVKSWCPGVMSIASEFLPDTIKFGEPSSPDSHWLYILSSQRYGIDEFVDPVDEEGLLQGLVEVCSTGTQALFPSSTDPNGKIIEWSDGSEREPTTISDEELLKQVGKLAAATLLIRHWPERAARRNMTLALAGGLMTAGWTADEARSFIGVVATATDGEHGLDYKECVRTTARNLEKGEHVGAWAELAELLGKPVVDCIMKWLAVNDRGDRHDRNKGDSPIRPQDLVDFIPRKSLFHSPSRVAYCDIEVGERSEVHEVRSRELRSWLQQKCFVATQKPARGPALDDAIAILEAIAWNDGEQREVALRIARRGEATYLDLANPKGQVVKITSDRYSVLKKSSIRFRRTRTMLPLPRPTEGGSIDDLREFINVGSEDDWKLVIAWLTFAFLPKGPFPVLALQGEQDTAKSTTAKVIRELIDPNMASLKMAPRALKDLMIGALHSWVVSFDNLSGVSRELSDAICCLAYGGAISGRTLYTNQEEHVITACRPVILNGIDTIATRGDLASRSIALTLPRISGKMRMPEADFWERFDLLRPRILGAILTIVSEALRHLPDVRLKQAPRMADFARWGAAIEISLGWPIGSFEEAYRKNREALSDSVIESNVLASEVRSFMAERQKPWVGTATKLLQVLTGNLGFQKPDSRSWPRNAAALGNMLRRSAPALRAMGIQVVFLQRQSSERRISLRLT